MRGFDTRSLPELVARHHRHWGSADGRLRGRARHGECAWILHQSLPWALLRSLKLARVPPFGLSGAAFTYGYVRAAVRRTPQVDDPQFRRFVRRELRERMRGPLAARAAATRRGVMSATVEPPETPDLREAAVHGVRWAAMVRGAAEVVLMASMILLARLISPAEFGYFAVAIIAQELAIVITAEGIGTALVQRKTVDREHLQAGLALALVTGLVFMVLTLVAAGLIVSPIFGARTADFVRLSSPLFLIAAAGTVPMALLRRRLAFQRLSMIDFGTSVMRVGVAVALAIAGLEGESLVFGGIAAGLTTTVLAWASAPAPLPRLRLQAAREVMSYGLPASIASISWVGFRNCDYAIIGARLGAVQAGYYFRAYKLAVEYQKKISIVMGQVGLPLLARSGDEMSGHARPHGAPDRDPHLPAAGDPRHHRARARPVAVRLGVDPRRRADADPRGGRRLDAGHRRGRRRAHGLRAPARAARLRLRPLRRVRRRRARSLTPWGLAGVAGAATVVHTAFIGRRLRPHGPRDRRELAATTVGRRRAGHRWLAGPRRRGGAGEHRAVGCRHAHPRAARGGHARRARALRADAAPDVPAAFATIVMLVRRVLPSAPRLPRLRHPLEVSP